MMKSKRLLTFSLLALFIVLQVVFFRGASERFDFVVEKQRSSAQRAIDENWSQEEQKKICADITNVILRKYHMNEMRTYVIFNVVIVIAICVIPLVKPRKIK